MEGGKLLQIRRSFSAAADDSDEYSSSSWIWRELLIGNL